MKDHDTTTDRHGADDCSSCGEECTPNGECPKSKRGCGHHCNHSWNQDKCCWCGATFDGDAMNFGQALEALQQGRLVRRSGWNGRGMYLFLLRGDYLQQQLLVLPEPLKIVDTVCMRTAQASIVVGWLASQTDMLSDDWEIVPPLGAEWSRD